MDIRLLKSSEIECRVQSVKKTSKSVGCILVLYKDARVDMKILDEIYGPKNWQRTHELINGNLFCNIDIWDKEKNQWVRKQDVGTESNTEKEKGQASDSFKRAGVNIGIGRELYTSPFIWINLNEGEWYSQTDPKTKKDKYFISSFVKFYIKSIGYNEDREINTLEIYDNNHKQRFSLGKPIAPPQNSNKSTTKPIVNNKPEPVKNVLTYAKDKKYKCEKCGTEITEKVAMYSTSKFKHVLCMNCQKK